MLAESSFTECREISLPVFHGPTVQFSTTTHSSTSAWSWCIPCRNICHSLGGSLQRGLGPEGLLVLLHCATKAFSPLWDVCVCVCVCVCQWSMKRQIHSRGSRSKYRPARAIHYLLFCVSWLTPCVVNNRDQYGYQQCLPNVMGFYVMWCSCHEKGVWPPCCPCDLAQGPCWIELTVFIVGEHGAVWLIVYLLFLEQHLSQRCPPFKCCIS